MMAHRPSIRTSRCAAAPGLELFALGAGDHCNGCSALPIGRGSAWFSWRYVKWRMPMASAARSTDIGTLRPKNISTPRALEIRHIAVGNGEWSSQE